MLQKIQEKLWNHLGKILFASIWDIKNSIFSESVCPRYQILFDCFSFVFGFPCVFWLYILKIFLRRWGIENDTFFIIKQHPNLNMNFISFKKHEMEITLNFLIFKDGTLNFFIFKKGNHITHGSWLMAHASRLVA